MQGRIAWLLVAVIVIGAAAVASYEAGMYAYPGEDAHDRATVTIVDDAGTTVAVVDVRVADTRRERIRGLSASTPIPNGSGMLFVHPEEGRQTYVMRNMSFSLDIIFIDADGQITSIQSATTPAPTAEEADLRQYSGRAKYVLEVPAGFTAAKGIEVGNEIEIEFDD